VQFDSRTKLVGVTGASNFVGTKPNLQDIAQSVKKADMHNLMEEKGSYFLVERSTTCSGKSC